MHYKKFYTCAVFSVFLLVLIRVDWVNGKEEGAPVEACVDMKPGHGFDSQNLTSSPFKTEIPAGVCHMDVINFNNVYSFLILFYIQFNRITSWRAKTWNLNYAQQITWFRSKVSLHNSRVKSMTLFDDLLIPFIWIRFPCDGIRWERWY